jgi:hypothetical protein
VGGKFHLKLITGGRPIVKKYREGKVKSTLKRELKVPEIAEMEPMGVSVVYQTHVFGDKSCFLDCSREAFLFWNVLLFD